MSDVTRIPDAIGQGDRQAAAKLIKLQYFVGLLIDKGVERLGISPATASHHGAYAKAWFRGKLKLQHDSPSG